MNGHIDQLNSFVHFAGSVLHLNLDSLYFNGGPPPGRTLLYLGSDILSEWDKQIESVCQHVNRVADRISSAHPEWCQARIDNAMITS